MSSRPPIACDLSAIDDSELQDHRENGQAVFKAISEIKELDNGYALRLSANTDLISRACAFIARERMYCPFFEFTLTIPPDHDPVWLKLTGREGVKPYIKEALLPKLDAPVTNSSIGRNAMNAIDPDTKVADLVAQHPHTWEVFKSHGCPDMRRGFFSLMARIMSIRNAARIHRIPLDELVADLEAAVSENRHQITDNP